MNSSHPTTSKKAHEANKHAAHVVDLAKRLADGKRPGVLATVDETGRPHVRWMATLSLEEFPLLYTITSPLSRKIEHISHNPEVSWMFASEDMTTLINISGKARVTEDVAKRNHLWKLLEDKSKAYFLSIATDGPGFAVIETEIENIECVIPKYDFRFVAHQEDLDSSRSS
jgi:general stress protein 26